MHSAVAGDAEGCWSSFSEVLVLGVKGSQVRVGTAPPADVTKLREELVDRQLAPY